MDTLATALYAATDDMLREHPDLAPWRPPVGITPRLSDAELVTLTTMQAILGYTSEAASMTASEPPFGAHPLAFMMPSRSVRDRALWEGAALRAVARRPSEPRS